MLAEVSFFVTLVGFTRFAPPEKAEGFNWSAEPMSQLNSTVTAPFAKLRKKICDDPQELTPILNGHTYSFSHSPVLSYVIELTNALAILRKVVLVGSDHGLQYSITSALSGRTERALMQRLLCQLEGI